MRSDYRSSPQKAGLFGAPYIASRKGGDILLVETARIEQEGSLRKSDLRREEEQMRRLRGIRLRFVPRNAGIFFGTNFAAFFFSRNFGVQHNFVVHSKVFSWIFWSGCQFSLPLQSFSLDILEWAVILLRTPKFLPEFFGVNG